MRALNVEELQLTPRKHVIAHVALTAHPWKVSAEKLSVSVAELIPGTHACVEYVEELSPTTHTR